MGPTIEELAEDAAVTFGRARRSHDRSAQRIRLGDVEAAVAWARAEAQRRGEAGSRRFEEIERSGGVHHFAARLGGRLAGFGRAIDMDGGVALMGGAVLPAFRGRGVYRALVRARWDHAAARGTPLLVVQAGPMSAPVLEGLGFARHGDLRLFSDPGVASRHGDD